MLFVNSALCSHRLVEQLPIADKQGSITLEIQSQVYFSD